ncbi:hypothetical protein HDU79_002837 [Rhizoclosmatium sp. JEL0117]|nr:hypothetical protein HDU79_002837 [Rhizoclosmatium sp. JEL0117]
MFSYGGRGGTSMRLAGYGGHDDDDEDNEEEKEEEASRQSTIVQPGSPVKPEQISSPVKATPPKAPVQEPVLPKAQSNSISPKPESTLKSVLKTTPSPSPAPVSAPAPTTIAPAPSANPAKPAQPEAAAKGNFSKGTPTPLALPVSAAINQVSPNSPSPLLPHVSDFHGTQSGSLRLSTKMSASKDRLDFNPDIQSQRSPSDEYHTSEFHGDQSGSLRLSERFTKESKDDLVFNATPKSQSSLTMSKELTNSKESLTYNPNVEFVSRNKQPNSTGDKFSALSISDKTTKEAPALDGMFNEEQVLKYIQVGEGQKISSTTTVEVLMKAIAIDNDWSDDELKADLALLHKYRFKTVKNLRGLSGHAWSELTDILPITKDLIRRSIAWKET